MPPLKVPLTLKEAAPFLQRAQEVEKVDPIIAYWCKYYAAQLGIDKMSGNTEAQSFLFSLMDDLEQLKSSLEKEDAVTNDTVGHAYIENFAYQVFLKADDQDRAGQATRETAHAFVAASKFLELLSIFGPLEEEVQSKIKYAKWKAAQISKALRSGTKPTSGPAEEGERADEEQVLAQLITPMHLQEVRAPTSPTEAPIDESERFTLPSAPTMDDKESSPCVQIMTAQSDEDEAPKQSKPTSSDPSPQRASTSSSTSQAYPSSEKPTDSTHKKALAKPLSTESWKTSASAVPLDVAEVTHIQKLTRWASSALDYEDWATARTNLQQALSMLDTIASHASLDSTNSA